MQIATPSYGYRPPLLLLFLLMFLQAPVQGQTNQETGLALFEKGAAIFSTDFDSSQYYIERALPLLEAAEDHDNYVNAINYLAFIARAKNELAKTDELIVKAYDEATRLLPDTSSTRLISTNNLAVYYQNIGDVDAAITTLNKLLDLSKETGDHERIAIAYENLGYAMRTDLEDYEQALSYYQQALQVRLEQIKRYNDELAFTYFSIGNTQLLQLQTEAAIANLEKSKSILATLSGDYVEELRVEVFTRLAEAYLADEQVAKANQVIQSALKIQQNRPEFSYNYTYEILARIRQAEGNTAQALQAYQQAIKVVEEKYQSYAAHQNVARRYIRLGAFEHERGQLTAALKHYQTGLIKLSVDFDDADYAALPPMHSIISNKDALEALEGKGRVLYALYHQNQETNYLTAALAAYQLADAIITEARQDIRTVASKNRHAGKVMPIYEGGIKTSLALYRLAGDTEDLATAFAFAERNKANLLLESLNEEQARRFGEVPVPLLEKEKKLRTDITFYQKKINLEKRKETDRNTEAIEAWDNQLFDLEEAYGELVQQLETEYPKYYQLKYNQHLATVDDIQTQILGSNAALIELFVGADSVYIFRVDANGLTVHTHAWGSTQQEQLTNLRKHIEQTDEDDPQAFAQLSYQVYQAYLAPLLKDLAASINQLIFVADDFFNYLPFDILIRQPPAPANLYGAEQLNYLLEDFAITNVYSATLLLNHRTTERPQAKGLFLGLAPSFSNLIADNRACTAGELYSLRCNQGEVDAIGKHIKGATLTGQEASLATFLANAPGYRILHLATHSCVDAEDPMLSKIYFAQDYLSLYDLTDLKLNADLTILSSCNSGTGELVTGDGVMSLARGFAQAGCPSTVMSLWSVDDCATSEIMVTFYKYLKGRKSKSQALRKAKLDYLNTADKVHQHPYYWAAFTQMGDPTPIFGRKGGISGVAWYWWALIGVVIATLIFRTKHTF